MASENENTVENLKRSYLAVYQNLHFSKTDKTEAEIADIDRRCLFTKYAMCKNSIDEDVAGSLLQNDLAKYSSLVDSLNGLNNYWKQFNSLNINTDNSPSEWKSNLTDPKVALQFLDPLPCNSDATLSCKNKKFIDRDVEKVMEIWKKGGKSPRMRKIPKQEERIVQNTKSSHSENKEDKSKIQRNVFTPKSHFSNETHNERSNERLCHNERPFSNPENINNERTNSNRVNLIFKTNQSSTEKREEKSEDKKFAGFKTARTVLGVQQAKNNKKPTVGSRPVQSVSSKQPIKKSLGGRALNSPFVNPFKDEQPKEEEPAEPIDERLKNIEPKMIELIRNEIMDSGNLITWDDIAGLEDAKRIIQEIVVYPMLRPDIFTGLRRPPKGILLFGPPGTGKTLIGKCIASQSKSTFFSISASSLTSKWVGEGEKMVRALFAVAQVEQPSVVFIDEIDSLLCQRSETEHESSRRMKTEFLVQLDGASTGDEDRILVIGATNRPYELDEAARRRLVKRLYVPLPELEARAQIVRNLLKSERNDLTPEDVYEIARLADGYSGADMTNLCKEASMGPIRSIPFNQLEAINKEDVRKVTFEDFKAALDSIRPSVSQKDLSVYIDWDRTYGTVSVHNRG